MAGARRDLAGIERDIKKLTQAIKDGVSGPKHQRRID
jgi:hypothetical protein